MRKGSSPLSKFARRSNCAIPLRPRWGRRSSRAPGPIPHYKRRLLANGTEAIKEFGLDMGAIELVVVENTPTVHNMIVCTLCSCYPRAVLGLPPSWYKSREYRARAVREPRAVLHEFGTEIPEFGRSAGARFDGRYALSGAANAPCPKRKSGHGAVGGSGHARLHDRRQPAPDAVNPRTIPRKDRGDRPCRFVQFHRSL